MKTEEIIMLIAKIAPSFEEIENRDVRMYTIMCTFNLLTLQVQFLSYSYDQFLNASCKLRSEFMQLSALLYTINVFMIDNLKYSSNSICCISDTQYEAIISFLLKSYPKKGMTVYYYSFSFLIMILFILNANSFFLFYTMYYFHLSYNK